jgi:hypothetical protein
VVLNWDFEKKFKKIRIGLVQINAEFDGQVYLPLVTGYLESFVRQWSRDANKFEFCLPIY